MKLIQRARWIVRRASVMSGPEIAYRLRQALTDGLEGVLRVVPSTRSRRGIDPAALATFMRRDAKQLPFPPYDRSVVDEERLLAGEVPVFGRWVAVTADPEFWHRDPFSGVVWPQRPSRQIDYRPGNPIGDVRVVWELNRLQHLFGLGVIADQDAQRRLSALSLIERHLSSWEAANLPGTGVNFISAMEEALRIVAVLHTYDIIRPWVSDTLRDRIALMALSHARHVARRLSLYSSAGNHTIAEAVGLLYASVVLCESPMAAGWRATARQLLGSEADRQIHPDGGGAEQATWYLLFVLDLLGLAQALLRFASEAPEARLDAAVARGRSFLHLMASTPDDLPRVGDSDDGYALAAALRTSWQDVPHPPLARSLPISGVSVVREDAGDRLVFLHKPLGMQPNFAHGHADCLSVLFRWQGVDVFVDPGTYQYGGDPEFRRYFRSTMAHNTVTVDRTDQSEQVAPFMWRRPYHPRLVLSRFEREGTRLLAVHDGYQSSGSLHWRGVAYLPRRFLAIWDCVTGAAERDVAVHWNLGCPIQSQALEERRLELACPGSAPLRIEASTGTLALWRGSVAPLIGWRSSSYASVEPSDLLEVRWARPADEPLVTVVWLGVPGGWAEVWSAVDEFRGYASR